MLKETSKQFVDLLAEKSVLLPLYKNRNIVVEIINSDDDEYAYIGFDKGVCGLLDNKPHDVDVSLNGNRIDLEKLISGKERLMVLESKGDISVNGSLPHLLALESLFLLTSQHSTLFNQ